MSHAQLLRAREKELLPMPTSSASRAVQCGTSHDLSRRWWRWREWCLQRIQRNESSKVHFQPSTVQLLNVITGVNGIQHGRERKFLRCLRLSDGRDRLSSTVFVDPHMFLYPRRSSISWCSSRPLSRARARRTMLSTCGRVRHFAEHSFLTLSSKRFPGDNPRRLCGRSKHSPELSTGASKGDWRRKRHRRRRRRRRRHRHRWWRW